MLTVQQFSDKLSTINSVIEMEEFVKSFSTAAPALLPYNGKLYTGLYLPVQQYQRDLSTNPAACEYFNSSALTQLRAVLAL